MNHLDAVNAMTHAEIYEAVHRGPGAGAALHVEDAWRTAHLIVVAAEERTRAAIAASAEGWEGSGADGARTGLSSLNDWMLEAIADARNTATSLTHQGFHAGDLRNAIPRPHAYELFEAQSAAQLNPADRAAADRLARAESTALDPRIQAEGEIAKERLRQYVDGSYDRLRDMSIWTTPPTITVDTSPVVSGGPSFGVGPGVSDLTPVSPAGGGAAPVTIGAGPGGTAPGVGPGGIGPGGGVPTTQATGAPVVPAIGPPGPGPAAGSAAVGAPAAGRPVAGSTALGSPAAGGAAVGSPAPGGPAAGPNRVAPYGPAPGAVVAGPGGAGTGPSRRLPPGAGGRGVRPLPPLEGHPAGGVRPTVPRAPAPIPTWRDLVAGQPGGAGGGSATGPGGSGAGRSAGGLGGVRPESPAGPAAPRPEPRVGPAAATEAGRGSGGHGLYPPMGAAGAGQQGQERRRASFLIDDSGAFDVSHLPCTEPVIGGEPETGP